MSLSNVDVSNFIEKSDSIWKIIEKTIYNDEFYDEVNKCSITKYIQNLNIIFKLTVYKSSNETVTKCQLVSRDGEKFHFANIPTLGMLCNRKDIDFETQTDIVIEITSDLSTESESKRLILANENAKTIKYLFNKFCFASKLIIYNVKETEMTDDFILLIIEKLKTNQLEYLSPISLHSILTFISKYDMSIHNIFDKKPNLKEFTIHVGASKIFKNKLLLNDKLWTFIDSIAKRNIQLKLSFDPNDISIFLAVTIFKYCQKNNINVLLNVENDESKFFDRIKNGISRNDYKIIKNLSSLLLTVNNLKDLEYIKYILTQIDNLENFKITFNNYIYLDMLTKNVHLEDIIKLYNHFFNFKTSIQKVNCFTLEYCSELYPTFFETHTLPEKFYDIFINSIFSSLPNSITIIKLIKLPYLKEEYFNFLHKSTSNLVTIAFKHCRYIPDDALLLFKKLRYVLITENIGVTIPSWVEVVLYKDFNNYISGTHFIPQLRKNKKRFYKLMKNTTFKNTFWLDENYIPNTVIFMKDILAWKDAIDLLNL